MTNYIDEFFKSIDVPCIEYGDMEAMELPGMYADASPEFRRDLKEVRKQRLREATIRKRAAREHQAEQTVH